MLKVLVDYAVWGMLSAAAAVIPAVACLLLFRRQQGPRAKLLTWYSLPGWNYHLKMWWARLQLHRSRRYTAHLAGCCGTSSQPALVDADEQFERPRKLAGENYMDSMMIQGTDLKGNVITVKVIRMRNRMAGVWIQLQLDDGSIYQLPDHPNTVIHNSGKSWSAKGLRLQMCKPLHRWRVTFNGMLRRGISHKYRTSDEGLEHVKFHFMWTSCSHIVLCEESCSVGLLSEAVAREPWKDGSWSNIRRELGEGYDQWGALQGVLCVAGQQEQTLYLRGLRQRRWGRVPPAGLHRSVNIAVVHDRGLMVSLTAACYRSGLTHVVMGHVLDNKGNQFLIDSCDFSLPHFGEDHDSIPANLRIKFSAGGKSYESRLQIPVDGRGTLCEGWPWSHMTRLALIRCHVGTSQGTGLLQCWYRYTGRCPVVAPRRTKFLVESSTQECPLVTNFADEACRNSNCVGGKGASLALLSTLQGSKVTVPPGLCLTVAAFRRQLREHSCLRDAVSTLEAISSGRLDADLKAQCEKTLQLFEATPVCEPVREALLSESRGVDLEGLCAVRSSAVGEDSEETSAAGQNASLLGVRGAEQVVLAVQKCWASYFSFQSVQYRRQHGQAVGSSSMGVVVQQMVVAHSAGVMFTAHPVSGDPRQILITANYGLGESVVSAEVEPDTITLLRSSGDRLVVHEVIRGSKSHKITVAETGGVKTEQLSQTEVDQLSISTEQALALGLLGIKVQAAFGAPRDIEWAIVQDSIYLLQARPITSLDAWSDFEILHEFDSPRNCHPEVLTTANLGEVMPGAMSPLSLSTLLPALNVALEQTIFGTLTNCTSILNISHGHVFLNVLTTTLVNVGEQISMANKVAEMGVFGHSVITPELHRLAVERNGTTGKGGVLKQLARMMLMLIKSKKCVVQADKLSSKLKIDTSAPTAEVLYENISENLDVLKQVSLLHSCVTSGNTFIEIVLLTVLMEGKEEFQMEHYNDISMLLSSCSEVVSADVPSALKDVARLLRRSSDVYEFCEQPAHRAYSWLQSNAPVVADRLKQFLNQHGHRSIKEFDFATETWGLNPSALMPSLQSMGRSRSEDEHSGQVLSARQTVDKLTTPQKSGTKLVLRLLLPACRSSVSRRESTKSSLVKVIHKLRLAYRQLGRLMMQQGLLPDPALVFYFTHHELRMVLHSGSPLLVNKALRRQRLWPHLDKLTFPEMIIGMPTPEETQVPALDPQSSVQVVGTPVYPGTVLGRACVILHLDQISSLQEGDILITRSTDIGWSPYFPILGGVVTELGGIISHGAVVAREYGLPCIVGARGATTAFHTGDLVLLAGSRGTIDRLKQGQA